MTVIIQEVIEELHKFLDDRLPNKYVYDENSIVQLYTRKGHHIVNGALARTLDIASLVIDEQKRGQRIGSRLIDEIHRVNPFEYTYIESLLNTSLYYHLIEDGWIDIPRSTPPCVYKRTDNINELSLCPLLGKNRTPPTIRDPLCTM